MNENGADQIQIEELEVFAHVGVPDEERAQPQRLLISLQLRPRTDFRQLGDDLARTIDYAAVCAATREFTGSRAFKLIETLANDLAAHLLAAFPIAGIRVEVRKFILPDTRYVAVSVLR
ncbi:MAG: dihydroneopterin aldolase [Chthoniobacterales bacterium]